MRTFQDLEKFVSDFNEKFGYNFSVSHKHKNTCWLWGEGNSGQRYGFDKCVEIIESYEQPIRFFHNEYGHEVCPICKNDWCGHIANDRVHRLMFVSDGFDDLYMKGRLWRAQPGRNFSPQNSGAGFLLISYTTPNHYATSMVVRGIDAIEDLIERNDFRSMNRVGFALMKVLSVEELHPAHHLRTSGQTHRLTSFDYVNLKELSNAEIVEILLNNHKLLFQ